MTTAIPNDKNNNNNNMKVRYSKQYFTQDNYFSTFGVKCEM